MGSNLHSFINLVELRAECIAKELQTHHLTATKNVRYMSLLVKSIIVYRYHEHFFRSAAFKVASKLKSNTFLLCIDGANGVTSVEQMNIENE